MNSAEEDFRVRRLWDVIRLNRIHLAVGSIIMGGGLLSAMYTESGSLPRAGAAIMLGIGSVPFASMAIKKPETGGVDDLTGIYSAPSGPEGLPGMTLEINWDAYERELSISEPLLVDA